MQENKEPIDTSKLKYALYARKSTEDEGRQVRSIGDQIKDCEKLAKELGVQVVKPYIEETKSAKTPGRRPKFTQMLKDIQANKYQGILCWHPDRLARNMIEAGQIIDMLDNGVIKDLRFHSHQFSNDANGKMLLGMLFVFSKHYSDDLSAKVSRGVKNNFAEGKASGVPKHGYKPNELGLYVPDTTHSLIVQAWQMREQGKGLKDILEYLHENGYQRKTKKGRVIQMGESTLSKMFQDPFYYGQLVQAGQTTDLRLIYDFVPTISEETYNNVQQISYSKSKGMYKLKKRATFMPLRQFVVCDYCKHLMYVGASKGRGDNSLRKLNYRCDNKECPRDKAQPDIQRGIRAKVLFDWVQHFLETDFQKIADQYDRYSKLIDNQSDEQRVQIQTQVRSKQGVLTRLNSELDNRSLALNSLPDKSGKAYENMSGKITELEAEIEEVETAITKLQDKLTDKTKLKLNNRGILEPRQNGGR